MNDNRDYNYPLDSETYREEYQAIADWIKEDSKVIDLGCGDGSLLLLLKNKGIEGIGVDISASAVSSVKNKGIKAIKGRIDIPLKFKDNEFDFSICNVTLQMVAYPEVLLSEMARISKKQIITFPNFAFLLNRLDLLFNGRIPRVMIPGYKWYSTGHIHQLSIADFCHFCREHGIKILDHRHTYPKRIFFIPKQILALFPNVFASTAVFLTSKKV